eukprot:547201-Pelagomonas_calceolata.AAC.1
MSVRRMSRQGQGELVEDEQAVAGVLVEDARWAGCGSVSRWEDERTEDEQAGEQVEDEQAAAGVLVEDARWAGCGRVSKWRKSRQAVACLQTFLVEEVKHSRHALLKRQQIRKNYGNNMATQGVAVEARRTSSSPAEHKNK